MDDEALPVVEGEKITIVSALRSPIYARTRLHFPCIDHALQYPLFIRHRLYRLLQSPSEGGVDRVADSFST